MSALKNKVAIVTGASSGIGFSTAKLFAREGARVVVGARRQSQLDELVEEIAAEGGEAVVLAGDVKDADYAHALVELATSHYGGLDVAFNNAGILGAPGPITEMTLAEWDETIATNLSSAFLCARYQIPAMQKRGGGSIIFTSSFVGYTAGMPGMAAYSASKAGLIGLSQSLAAEYGSAGIRVNALLPGGTDTAMSRQFASTPESLAFVQGLHAMKRIADPDEIAQSALYLASAQSSFTTGTAMLVDGGVSINRT
jgi:NAD(P)-dependent dehydrogenase (short-subunit alcohol dehydrogenase family)